MNPNIDKAARICRQLPCNKRKLSEISARMAILKVERSQRANRREVRSYWCQRCRAYHLTSQEKRA